MIVIITVSGLEACVVTAAELVLRGQAARHGTQVGLTLRKPRELADGRSHESVGRTRAVQERCVCLQLSHPLVTKEIFLN